jgi:probable HAF family extracellular repeat protein
LHCRGYSFLRDGDAGRTRRAKQERSQLETGLARPQNQVSLINEPLLPDVAAIPRRSAVVAKSSISRPSPQRRPQELGLNPKLTSQKRETLMKSGFLTRFTAPALLALLIPASVGAQNTRYKLINFGTLGGPNNWFCNDLNLGGGACAILNNRGTMVSGADTTLANPNYQNPSPFFPPFTVPGDPYIQHAYQWNGGLQDLGALPGGYNSWAQAVSANGLVTGLSETGAFDPLTGWPSVHAALWQNSKVTDVGTVGGGYESIGAGVNSRGQVVGSSLNTVPDSFWFFSTQSRAYSWQNGVILDLGTLGTGTDAFAYWVNEKGQVAGSSFTNMTVNPVLTYCTAFQIETPTMDPFLWDKGTMTDLGTLGGTCGLPNAMNNRGQVTGVSDLAGDVYYHAFLWTNPGPMQDLGTLGGFISVANWINGAGDVVGGSFTTTATNSPFHAFLWRNGVMTDLARNTTECSFALGINSRDQIVGFSCDSPNALFWDNGKEINLNMFNRPGSGLKRLELAYNINDSGEITGLGAPPGCQDVFSCGQPFVLVPCDDADDNTGCTDGSEASSVTAFASDSPANPPDPDAMLHRLSWRNLVWFHPSTNPPMPVVTLQPSSLDFGTVTYGKSSTLTASLTNSGGTALHISEISITGTNTADFSQTNTCGRRVAAGRSCTIMVTFKPLGGFLETFTADVSISDNAGGSPQTLPLSGTGSPECSYSCSECPARICTCTLFGCVPFVPQQHAELLVDPVSTFQNRPAPGSGCPIGTQSTATKTRN